VDTSSGLVWAALATLMGILLAGAYLGLNLLDAKAATQTSVRPSSGRYDNYVAPESVCPGGEALAAPAAAQEETMLCLLNYARRVRGLGELSTVAPLMNSARIKADDIARCRDFSHTACGATVVSAFERGAYVSPYQSSRYGENLAWGAAEAGSPRGALLGWLESNDHRDNLFRADWTEQGIAMLYVGDFRGIADSRVWVSHFGRRG
jgi:uncharacterized protein YkwD